jgi:protein gp37
MGENSLISWTDHTVNFVIGCTKVDELCTNCYADDMDDRRFSRTLGGGTPATPIRHWGKDAPRYLKWENAVKEIIALDRKAGKAGRIDKVFINSLSDTFEDRRDLDIAREAFFAISMASTNLIFQVLTKRPENINKMVPKQWLENWPKHVWIGASVGHQKSADERIPHLLKVPATIRFLSCEPLLGPVNLNLTRFVPWANAGGPNECEHGYAAGIPCVRCKPNPVWVIVGGESGDGHRQMDLQWMRSIKEQCNAAGVAFYAKQDSGPRPGMRGRIPDDLWVQEFPV